MRLRFISRVRFEPRSDQLDCTSRDEMRKLCIRVDQNRAVYLSHFKTSGQKPTRPFIIRIIS